MTVKLLKNGRLVTYQDLPHGLCQTHPEVVNPEIPAFIREHAAPRSNEKIEVQIVDAPATV